jgi:anti-sigma28 factor (negative regulator of flagellin synthesis)
MKIDDRVSYFMALLQKEPSQSLRSEASPLSSQKEHTPHVVVDISPSALQRSEDEAKRERLNTIRRQLADGSYNISGKDVADKMLRILKS